MRIQRMQWAGILLENEENVLMIDPAFKFNKEFLGLPLEKIYDFSAFKKPDLILITHLHPDHFDPESILEHFGENIHLVVPKPCLEEVKSSGFNMVTGLQIGETIKCGEFEIFAEYSVDGAGDEQVSWIIKDRNQTFIHCGDTLWNGRWWNIANTYGPIDIAFLPVNQAIVNRGKGIIPSNQPICLGPEEAISAATILKSKILVPIHYGTFHNPPVYNETKSLIERLLSSEKNFEVKFLKNKEEFIYES
ncbi:MBL fold metallo-hydrolase [Bacillus pseudomycoides]|nr:MBL fold metallo-hydrolase [Bacillus pseudomycoides]MED1537060.1 MBL fold metallo-hydrolase [Bacillus pseudomycoides]